jgi:hypothetical protein
MASILYLLLPHGSDRLEPIPLTASIDAAVPPPPPLHQPVFVAQPDAALAFDESTMIREDVARLGLMGREVRWLEPLMNTPHWRRDDVADSPSWVNANGVRLIWRIGNGRVAGASVQFPAGALSADLTALSGLFVGQHDHLPIHAEAILAAEPRQKNGDFVAANGRRFYYRVQLTGQETLPSGPESFELSLRPFGAD